MHGRVTQVDGMQNTGCFDLNCAGFVQTSIDVLLGVDITDYYGSDITIQVSVVSKNFDIFGLSILITFP